MSKFPLLVLPWFKSGCLRLTNFEVYTFLTKLNFLKFCIILLTKKNICPSDSKMQILTSMFTQIKLIKLIKLAVLVSGPQHSLCWISRCFIRWTTIVHPINGSTIDRNTSISVVSNTRITKHAWSSINTQKPGFGS